MKRALKEFSTTAAVAVCSALLGVGIGFVQGEIVARGRDKLYEATFAGGAAMIGGFVALFLGPILYYVLRRRILFEQFCYIAMLTAVIGGAAGWLFSMSSNGRGWESMFVTPVAAILLAVGFARWQPRVASRDH